MKIFIFYMKLSEIGHERGGGVQNPCLRAIIRHMDRAWMQTLRVCRASVAIIAVWIVVYITGRFIELPPLLEGRGISLLRGEYYRFLTGPLLHRNLAHLLLNCVTMFWVGYYMEAAVGSLRFLLFGLVTATLAEFVYACLFRTSLYNIGGSAWIFSYIGLIAVCLLMKPGFPRFRLGTWYGNWILGCVVLGNLPFWPLVDVGAVMIHLIAFLLGGGLGALGLWLKIL